MFYAYDDTEDSCGAHVFGERTIMATLGRLMSLLFTLWTW
ncbi:IS1 family transposase [Escherichia coli]